MGRAPSCDGCRNDFYNDGNNPLGVKRCWSRDGAKPVTRYRIHINSLPGSPRAFERVRVFDCRYEQGFALYKGLPDFVKIEDVAGVTPLA